MFNVAKVEQKKDKLTEKYLTDSIFWYCLSMQCYKMCPQRNLPCIPVFFHWSREVRHGIVLASLMWVSLCFQRQRLASEAERLQREHLWQDGIKVKSEITGYFLLSNAFVHFDLSNRHSYMYYSSTYWEPLI